MLQLRNCGPGLPPEGRFFSAAIWENSHGDQGIWEKFISLIFPIFL